MSTSPPQQILPDPEVIDLEPTMDVAVAEPWTVKGVAPSLAPAPAGGALASLAGETHSLRRRRLAAAALFLTLTFAVVLVWRLVSYGLGGDAWVTLTTGGLRFAIAAIVAGLLVSGIPLTHGQVKILEYVLFGSFTLLMAVNQYIVNLDLLRQGDVPGVISFVKNGVSATVILMIIYGMFIPNDPRDTAKVVLTMALVLVVALVLVMEHPDVEAIVEQMHTTDHSGSNVLILMIGAALSIYGSYVLNGLRTELHEARKYGHYQLVRKLGEGGMGEVYLAEHLLLKRPCALKLVKPGSGTDPVVLARFEREVQSAARLSHPNKIEIFDYGHTGDGTFYYVMEYLQGLSLADLVRQNGPLPPGRVIYLFRQVCAGLAEAHALGLVHRDLKPANLFVAVRGGEADVAKVLDFGLVKLTRDPGAAELSSEMTVSGTPMYMAPEQAIGDRSLDARADIYALGAMMYYSLTGRAPFTGENAFEVMMAHARDPVVPPSQIVPGVPEDLEKVVLRCLAKKPAERFVSVRALSQALCACGAATEWGANRAEAWWTAQGLTALNNPTPEPVEVAS
jgi:serine/threonine-protein kinase